MLLEEFLKPLDVSPEQLAEAIHLPSRQVSEIIHQRGALTPAIALCLAIYIGMSAQFWMDLQLRWDLYHALQSDEKLLNAIEPLPRPDMPELMKLAGIEEKDTE
jgi:addiction module HigA family antidote